jgi:XTP/dITP diphosphohydrolase
LTEKGTLRKKVCFFATGNTHKFDEARMLLAEYGISVAMLRIKSMEVQDDDIENVAKASALDAASKSRLPFIVEDAGLFIDALNGFPGPYSAYVYRTIGKEGILKLLDGSVDRKARFKSAVVFCSPKKDMKSFLGVVEGGIAKEMRGSSGFGFDPIFEPDEHRGKTFGELTNKEKNNISHRARALRKFAEWYKSRY